MHSFVRYQRKTREVEDPEHAAVYATTADACRMRITWYQTHFDAILLDAPYLQPPLVDGSDPLPFRLMWTGEKLERRQILGMIWSVYEEFYQHTNGVAIEDVKDCFRRVSEME